MWCKVHAVELYSFTIVYNRLRELRAVAIFDDHVLRRGVPGPPFSRNMSQPIVLSGLLTSSMSFDKRAVKPSVKRLGHDGEIQDGERSTCDPRTGELRTRVMLPGARLYEVNRSCDWFVGVEW